MSEATDAGRLRPVNAWDIEQMAERMCESRRARTALACRGDADNSTYWRAVRAHERRRNALRRLAYVLERQNGGTR